MDAFKDVLLPDYSNHDVWTKQTRTLLYPLGLNYSPNVPMYCHTLKGYRGSDMDHRSVSARAASIISATISPELLPRVPRDDLLDVAKLLRHLRQSAKPFRFLDLPAKLRHRIYEYCFVREWGDHQEHRLTSYIDIEGLHRKVTPLPAITQASRQIRAESRSMYFAKHTFQFWLKIKDPISIINQWTEEIAGADLKHLHKLLILDSTWHFTQIVFSVEDGLLVEDGPSRLTRNISKQVTRVEPIRKTLGLKGESIILLVIDNPTVWT